MQIQISEAPPAEAAQGHPSSLSSLLNNSSHVQQVRATALLNLSLCGHLSTIWLHVLRTTVSNLESCDNVVACASDWPCSGVNTGVLVGSPHAGAVP